MDLAAVGILAVIALYALLWRHKKPSRGQGVLIVRLYADKLVQESRIKCQFVYTGETATVYELRIPIENKKIDLCLIKRVTYAVEMLPELEVESPDFPPTLVSYGDNLILVNSKTGVFTIS